MPQRGLVRALPPTRLLRITPQNVGGSTWVSSKFGAGGYALGTIFSASYANNKAVVAYETFPYELTIDAARVYIDTGNAGANAVVGVLIYDLTRGSLLVNAGTASINTTGEKTFTFQQATIPGGAAIASVLYFKGLDTAGTNPSYGSWSTVLWGALDRHRSSSPSGNNYNLLAGDIFLPWAANGNPPITSDWLMGSATPADQGSIPRIWLRVNETVRKSSPS